jgi:hypothetical protein
MKFSFTVVLGITFVIAILVFASSLFAVSNHSENAFSHKYESLVTSPKLIVDKYLTGAVGGALMHLDAMWGNSLSQTVNNASIGYIANGSSFLHELSSLVARSPQTASVNCSTSNHLSLIPCDSASSKVSKFMQQFSPSMNSTSQLMRSFVNNRVSDIPSQKLHPAAPDVLADVELSDEAGGDDLACTPAFPPKCRMYPYVRFWNKRFYKEDCYASPLRPAPAGNSSFPPLSARKYLLFEPDRGGWNNIRMAAETAIILAHATGRTLVLPPQRDFYLLNRNKNEKDKSTFDKFFDLQKIAESLDMIDMHTFMVEIAGKVCGRCCWFLPPLVVR